LRGTYKATLAKGFAAALIAAVLGGCGSNSPQNIKPATASLITIIQDAPVCDAISASLTLTGLNFTPIGGGFPAGYLTTTPAFAPSIRVNLQLLRDFNTVLYIAPVNAGSYQQATMNVELAQIATYQPGQNPPVSLLTTTLTQPKPIINLNPPLVITAGQPNVLLLDFNAQQMLQTDATGQLTGTVNPVVNATQLTATNGNGFVELDDLSGFVRSTTPISASGTPLFTGSFLMQLLGPSVSGNPALTMNLTANTELIGFVDLPHLLPDSYVEVDASLDSQGNFVGNKVEFQAVEHPFAGIGAEATPSTALIGTVTAITTDQTGYPTQFNLWIRDAEPQDTANITLDSIFQVNLNSGTLFQISALGPNFANLSFGPQNLGVGQEIVVHGAYTKVPSSTGTKSNLPVTVSPSAIFLKLQSIQGSLGSVVTAGSDGVTGAFVLNPCSTLQQQAPVYVLTNNQTNFVKVTGLGALTPQMNLLVKGMPYYEPQGGVFNGVTVPPGTLVVQAKQVHQL